MATVYQLWVETCVPSSSPFLGGGGEGRANEGGEGHVQGPGDGVHAQGDEVMGGRRRGRRESET